MDLGRCSPTTLHRLADPLQGHVQGVREGAEVHSRPWSEVYVLAQGWNVLAVPDNLVLF